MPVDVLCATCGAIDGQAMDALAAIFASGVSLASLAAADIYDRGLMERDRELNAPMPADVSSPEYDAWERRMKAIEQNRSMAIDEGDPVVWIDYGTDRDVYQTASGHEYWMELDQFDN